MDKSEAIGLRARGDTIKIKLKRVESGRKSNYVRGRRRRSFVGRQGLDGKRMNGALHEVGHGIIHQTVSGDARQSRETGRDDAHPIMPAALGSDMAHVLRAVVVDGERQRRQLRNQTPLDFGDHARLARSVATGSAVRVKPASASAASSSMWSR